MQQGVRQRQEETLREDALGEEHRNQAAVTLRVAVWAACQGHWEHQHVHSPHAERMVAERHNLAALRMGTQRAVEEEQTQPARVQRAQKGP